MLKNAFLRESIACIQPCTPHCQASIPAADNSGTTRRRTSARQQQSGQHFFPAVSLSLSLLRVIVHVYRQPTTVYERSRERNSSRTVCTSATRGSTRRKGISVVSRARHCPAGSIYIPYSPENWSEADTRYCELEFLAQ